MPAQKVHMRPRDQILMASTSGFTLGFLLINFVLHVSGFGFHVSNLYGLTCTRPFKDCSQGFGQLHKSIPARKVRRSLSLYAQDTQLAGSKIMISAENDLSGAWAEDGTRSKRWFEETELERQSKVISVRVSHILVSADDLAESLMEQVRSGADFNELAKAISACEHTRTEGGAVGWVGHLDSHLDDMLPPAARTAALQQKPGDVVKCQSPLGIHLIKVASTREGLGECAIEHRARDADAAASIVRCGSLN